jgi:diguanylate cyclase (GGDEF)-like protein
MVPRVWLPTRRTFPKKEPQPMHHAENPRALSILVLTENRGLSRELSHFLNVAGYRTLAATDPRSALAALATGTAQVALVDARLGSRDHWAVCRLLREQATPGGLFQFLLIDDPDDTQLQEALESGVDDFLLLPVRYGELLARVRAAVRVLEHDRRASQQEPTDEATGLWSRCAFMAQLRNNWSAAGEAFTSVACVVIDLDFFSAVQRRDGDPSAAALLAAVAQELNDIRVESEVLVCLGADRFGVMLPGANAATASAWAERARAALAAKTFAAGKANCQITASFGVASSDTAQSADDLLDQAIAALECAKASGRNCVTRWGEPADELRLASTPGMLFEGTVAGDVLTPCSVFLQPGEPASHAAELLQQTRLEAIPVVDGSGKLLGLCTQEHAASEDVQRHASRLVRDVMITDVRRFGRQEEFATLMDFFTLDPLAWAVVVDDGRPVGVLNCDSLLALSQPVGALSPASQPRFVETTDFLLVPEASLEERGQPA